MKRELALLVLLFIFSESQAQNKKQPNIHFDTDYFKAVNHWVVLPENSAGSYLLGYIYLDRISGFTFILEGIVVTNGSKWQMKSREEKYIVRKSMAKNALVLLLSQKQIKMLHLPENPEWLKAYGLDKDTPEDLIAIGYHYNAIGQNRLAIPFLEKAFLQNPKTKNGAFELAYAYNAAQEYEKAIAVLNKAIISGQQDYMVFRELGFALLKTANYDAAEKTYEKGLSACENNTQRTEMAIDMAQAFFNLKQPENFKKWMTLLKLYCETGPKNPNESSTLQR